MAHCITGPVDLVSHEVLNMNETLTLQEALVCCGVTPTIRRLHKKFG
jgi:hypothetical protein